MHSSTAPSLHANTGACTLVYVDLGANIGDSLVDLARRDNGDLGLGRQLERALPSWSPAATCVYAFEPNPAHNAALERVAQSLGSNFSRLSIFTETAVVSDNATSIRLSAGKARNAVGGRVGGVVGVLVRAVNLAQWLRVECAPRHPGRPIVVRMDIESQEYLVLTDLATSGAPREVKERYNTSLYLAVEWHRNLRADALSRRARLMKHLDRALWEKNHAVIVPPADAPLKGYWGHFFQQNVDGVGVLVSEGDWMLNASVPNRVRMPPKTAQNRTAASTAARTKWASAARRRTVLTTLHRMRRATATLEQNYEKVLLYMLAVAGVNVPE